MLDTDTPTSAADDAAPEQPTPPRRRRAASRPAGPPAPVVVEPAAPAPADQVDDQPEAPVEDQPAPEPDSIDEPAAPVVHDAAAENVAQDELDETADPAAQGVTAPEDGAEQEPASAASAPAQPASEVIELDPVSEPSGLDTPELTDVPAAPVEEQAGPVDEQPEPVAPRRRRATRATAPARAAAEQTDVEQQTAGQTETQLDPQLTLPSEQPDEPDSIAPLSLQELPTLDEIAPAAAEPRARRRRRKAEPEAAEPEAVAPGDEAADETVDPVSESLNELTRSGGRKRTRKVAETDTAEALEELAAAIGGQIEPGDATASDDADTETTAELDADETDAEDEAGDGDSEPRRRRRRRGGRRRRRGGSGDAAESPDEDDSAEDDDDTLEVADEGEAGSDADAAPDSGEAGSSTRRRRRRRRRGEDTTGAEDDPSDVVVRVREPRRSRSSDEVTSIEGSTRMEAKRQRRRDGRAAGRRRSPILSEAEFLARRESVDRRMMIRQADDYTQIAVLEDGILVEHYVDRASATSMIGNVYLGKVQNVLPSMEAAFVDIGRGRNAVLYAGEVDWDAFGVTGGDRKMEKVFKSGQSVLVQVTKDPVGAKGARLTAHVSVPGRYVVYSPGGQLSGISRKLPEEERSRLKGILEDLVGDTASVIVRTAAEGATEDELVRDVNRLKAQWEIIEKKVKAGKSPEQLYAEPDLTVRIVRDLFTEDFGQLVVDGNGKGEDAWDTVDAYVSHVAPHLKERLVHWDRAATGDLFAAHRIDEQIAKALERKVFLPSGGSLIIDRTEAMTVIDVNTGKFTGTSGNLEATVTSNNLEAAEEIVRQLRLRDIGGIIVVDFIDMVLPANRDLLLRRLVECLGRDRTRHQVAEVTSLGLVQMTRKRIGTGLAEAFTVTCETCHGRGYHRHDTPVDSQSAADGGEREQGRRRRG